MKARLIDKISKQFVEFEHPENESVSSSAQIQDDSSTKALVPFVNWIRNDHDVLTLSDCRLDSLQGVDASLALLRSWRNDNVNLEWKGEDRWIMQSVSHTVIQRNGNKIVKCSISLSLVKKPKTAVFLSVNKPQQAKTKAKLTKKEIAQNKPLKRK